MPNDTIKLELTNKEARSVLAALNFWYDEMLQCGSKPTAYAEHFDNHEPLDGEAVMALYLQIKHSPAFDGDNKPLYWKEGLK